jgi:hypothetical protein
MVAVQPQPAQRGNSTPEEFAVELGAIQSRDGWGGLDRYARASASVGVLVMELGIDSSRYATEL